MEPPGVLPPDRDRDKYFTTTQPNVNTSTATNQLTSSTSIGGVSTSASTTGQLQSSTTSSAQQQQPIERLSRPMAFDKI